VFDDEFNGTTLDSTKWSTYYGNGIAGLRRPSADSLDGQGHLVITAKMVNGSLVSGGLSAKYSRTYGYYEFRVRTESDPTATMSGVVMTWPTSGRWPTDGENDMYETGTSPARANFSTFVHYSSSNRFYYYIHNANATEWHTIGMDWKPGYIKIYRDGVLVWTLTDTNAIPDVPHHVAIQLDAMVNHVLTQPVHMYVDYIRVYQ
jgi:beta-glucanase (GH16 family)